MPYFGWIEVEVRLVREGFGIEGKESAIVATRTARIEEMKAREFVVEEIDGHSTPVVKAVRDAVKGAFDEDDMGDMRQRWAAAQQHLTPEKMRAALEVLEA